MSSATYTDITVTNTLLSDNVEATSINTDSINVTDAIITNLQCNTITSNDDLIIGDSTANTEIKGNIINIGITGGTVNLLGTTTYVNTTNTNIKDNCITLNKGGINAINSGIEIEENNAIVASLKLDSADNFVIVSPNNKLTVDNLTATNIQVSNITSAGSVTLGTDSTSIINMNGQLKFDNSLQKKIAFYDVNNNDFQYNGINTASGIVGYNAQSSSISHVFYNGVNSTSKLESLRINNRTASTTKTTGTLVIAGTGGIGCGGDIYCTNLNGNITTASQPNITSLGTLTSLTVSGALNGTLSTVAQPNITSVGTLTSLNVSTTITAGTVASNGSVTCSSLSATGSIVGTISSASASQPNITTVGNLTNIQNTTGTMQIGALGTNLYIHNTTGKVGFGTGSSLSATEKVEIVGGLKVDNLNLASFTPTTLNTTTLTVSGVSSLNGNVTLGTTASDSLTLNSSITCNVPFPYRSINRGHMTTSANLLLLSSLNETHIYEYDSATAISSFFVNTTMVEDAVYEMNLFLWGDSAGGNKIGWYPNGLTTWGANQFYTWVQHDTPSARMDSYFNIRAKSTSAGVALNINAKINNKRTMKNVQLQVMNTAYCAQIYGIWSTNPATSYDSLTTTGFTYDTTTQWSSVGKFDTVSTGANTFRKYFCTIKRVA